MGIAQKPINLAGMLHLENRFVVGNARKPVYPADKTYKFGMQQLKNKFVVGNARQPVNPSDKTYNFGMSQLGNKFVVVKPIILKCNY